MRALIFDEERLSRGALAQVLSDRRDLEIVDETGDYTNAFTLLQERHYEIVLLDIRTPELSGLELADHLNKRAKPTPSIVFVSAHSEYALEAFERHAVDYVLKPYTSTRIQEALDAAVRRAEAERTAVLMKTLPGLETLLTRTTKIAIKSNGRILLVSPAEISTVEAQGNYVLLRGGTGSYLLRESISTLEKKLIPFGFLRIHRSLLVNSACVEEIEPCTTGDYMLRIRGGKELSVTRTYKRNLTGMAQFWIGTDTIGRNHSIS